jgi:hypothetical protein
MSTETIYALTLDGAFVYVGRSVNVRDRVHAHQSRGISFDSVVRLAEVPTEASEDVEARAIKFLAPTANKRRDGRGRHSRFKPNMTGFNVPMPVGLAKKIKELARKDSRTTAAWIRIKLTEIVRRSRAAKRGIAA